MVFVSFLSVSCSKNKGDDQPFRIVGLNGESRQVQTRMPELNARILESQSHQTSSSSPMMEQAPQQMMEQAPQQMAMQQPQTVAAPNSETVAEDALKATMQADQGKPVYNLTSNEAVDAKKTENTPQDEMVSVGAVNDKEQEIEYDLSEDAKSDKQSAKKEKHKVEKASVAKEDGEVKVAITKEKKGSGKGGKIFVQTGSFSTVDNAKHEFSKMQKFHKGKIEEAEYEGKTVYRVLLGPLSNDKRAKGLVRKIKASGHDAIVVKHK